MRIWEREEFVWTEKKREKKKSVRVTDFQNVMPETDSLSVRLPFYRCLCYWNSSADSALRSSERLFSSVADFALHAALSSRTSPIARPFRHRHRFRFWCRRQFCLFPQVRQSHFYLVLQESHKFFLVSLYFHVLTNVMPWLEKETQTARKF